MALNLNVIMFFPECNTACTYEYEPVCGSNGKKCGNKCQLEVEACLTGETITVDFEGTACEKGKCTKLI